MTKNPVVTALAGLLVGLMVGYVLGQRQTRPQPAAAMGDPHAGVPGAPPLSQLGEQAPGGRAMPEGQARLREQLREIQALLEKDPNNYQHRVQLGNAYYDLGDFPRAIDAYEQARALRDDSADVLTDLGVCYRETNQPKRAVELFDKAAALAPGHWQSRYNAAVVYLFDLGDAASAEAELEKLKAIDPRPPDMPDLAGLEAEIAKRRQ